MLREISFWLAQTRRQGDAGHMSEGAEKELRELRETVEYLAELSATQHTLLMRVMAHNHAHLAMIRDLLVRSGEDRTKLLLQLKSAYQTAIGSYHEQYEKFEKSGNVKDLLDGPEFPDSTLSN